MKWYIKAAETNDVCTVLFYFQDQPMGYTTSTPGVLQTDIDYLHNDEYAIHIYPNENEAKKDVNDNWWWAETYDPDTVIQYSGQQKVSDITVDNKEQFGKLIVPKVVPFSDKLHSQIKFKIVNLSNFVE